MLCSTSWSSTTARLFQRKRKALISGLKEILKCGEHREMNSVQKNSVQREFYPLAIQYCYQSGWHATFLETRNKEGHQYPPWTLHLLLCGLQWVMHQENEHIENTAYWPISVHKGHLIYSNIFSSKCTVHRKLLTSVDHYKDATC